MNTQRTIYNCILRLFVFDVDRFSLWMLCVKKNEINQLIFYVIETVIQGTIGIYMGHLSKNLTIFLREHASKNKSPMFHNEWNGSYDIF
jgi:hypothetical protein